MSETTTTTNGKLKQSNLVRVNGNQTFLLPFGLGVVVPTHWTNQRTTIHAKRNCIHCAGSKHPTRDVSAHVGIEIRQTSINRCIVLLPPAASQVLISEVDRLRLVSKPLKVTMKRNGNSKRSPIDVTVRAYEPKVKPNIERLEAIDCLIRVLWERMYRDDVDIDIIQAENTFTRLI